MGDLGDLGDLDPWRGKMSKAAPVMIGLVNVALAVERRYYGRPEAA